MAVSAVAAPAGRRSLPGLPLRGVLPAGQLQPPPLSVQRRSCPAAAPQWPTHATDMSRLPGNPKARTVVKRVGRGFTAMCSAACAPNSPSAVAAATRTRQSASSISLAIIAACGAACEPSPPSTATAASRTRQSAAAQTGSSELCTATKCGHGNRSSHVKPFGGILCSQTVVVQPSRKCNRVPKSVVTPEPPHDHNRSVANVGIAVL